MNISRKTKTVKLVLDLFESTNNAISVVDLVSRPQALNVKAIAVEVNISDLSLNFLTKRLLLLSSSFSLIFLNSNPKAINWLFNILN